MPRLRTHNIRITHEFLGDFGERPVCFKEASELSWAELHRRLGVDPETPRRWRDKGVSPTGEHLMAPLALADSFGLGHLFRD